MLTKVVGLEVGRVRIITQMTYVVEKDGIVEEIPRNWFEYHQWQTIIPYRYSDYSIATRE
jgi:hypothetical protein